MENITIGINQRIPIHILELAICAALQDDASPEYLTYRSFCRLQHARSPDKHRGCGHFNFLEGKIYF